MALLKPCPEGPVLYIGAKNVLCDFFSYFMKAIYKIAKTV